MIPTIVPEPCGKRIYNKFGQYAWTCGKGTLRCPNCTTAADRLLDTAYCAGQFGSWEYVLAWNLALAALFCAAADQQQEEDRTCLYCGGPCHVSMCRDCS